MIGKWIREPGWENEESEDTNERMKAQRTRVRENSGQDRFNVGLHAQGGDWEGRNDLAYPSVPFPKHPLSYLPFGEPYLSYGRYRDPADHPTIRSLQHASRHSVLASAQRKKQEPHPKEHAQHWGQLINIQSSLRSAVAPNRLKS